MRKIISFIHSSFNGVVTGDPARDKTNWMVWATPPNPDYLSTVMETVDTILLGRGTYEDLGAGWPNMTSPLAHKINTVHKVVVTGDHPLNELQWGDFEAPVQLIGGHIEEQVKALKDRKGGDILILGSPVLVRALTDADLIDEYQIKLHPVVVTVGEHLFDGLKKRKDFRLLEVEALGDGGVLVKYASLSK